MIVSPKTNPNDISSREGIESGLRKEVERVPGPLITAPSSIVCSGQATMNKSTLFPKFPTELRIRICKEAMATRGV
jgi:hypothetical protein